MLHITFRKSARLAPFALLLASSAARAFPTGNPFPGPSGLNVVPTTQTVPERGLEAALQAEYVSIDDNEGGGRAVELPLLSATYGLRNGEIGALYNRERTSGDGFTSRNDYFAVHGKYRFLDRVVNARDRAQLAVGAHFYEFGSDDGDDLGSVSSAYLTGSYEFRRPNARPFARLHAGALFQRSEREGDRDNVLRPFVGAELFASRELTLVADFLARQDDAQRAFALSLRFSPQRENAPSPFSAQVGIGRLRSDTKLFAGLSYTFDTRSKSQRATPLAPASAVPQR